MEIFCIYFFPVSLNATWRDKTATKYECVALCGCVVCVCGCVCVCVVWVSRGMGAVGRKRGDTKKQGQKYQNTIAFKAG